MYFGIIITVSILAHYHPLALSSYLWPSVSLWLLFGVHLACYLPVCFPLSCILSVPRPSFVPFCTREYYVRLHRVVVFRSTKKLFPAPVSSIFTLDTYY